MQNWRHLTEIPSKYKKTKALHLTNVMKCKGKNNCITTLTSYQCKKSKNVFILSTLHPDVPVPTEGNLKKKLEIFLFYNKNKVAIIVFDQMTRMYSVKASSRCWPIHVFYNTGCS